MAHSMMTTLGAAVLATGAMAQDLAKPFRVEANGAPINVTVGHAGPYVHDFDGDGVRDLLVGQFGDRGRLRIYKNEGTNQAPRFGEHAWFMAGGEIAVSEAS